MKVRLLSFLCLLFVGANRPAQASDVHSTKVSFKPMSLEKDERGFVLEIEASVDEAALLDKKALLTQGMAKLLQEHHQLLNQQDLSTSFDGESSLFTFRIPQSALVPSAQKSFTACVAGWYSDLSLDDRMKFKIAVGEGNRDDTSSMRSKLKDYVSTHLVNCVNGSESFSSDDFLQYYSDLYVENKMKNKALDQVTQGYARIYDASYAIFQQDFDKKTRADLLAKAGRYFDSFANLGLHQSAKLERVSAGLAASKAFTPARLYSLSLSDFLDSQALSQGFAAIAQGQASSQAFERALFWVNELHSQCAHEFFIDPSGQECRQKLATKEFYWLEFSRNSSQFKFLIIL